MTQAVPPQAADETEDVLEEINDDLGSRWTLGPRLSGGLLGGAWQVDDVDTRAVLKWHAPGSRVPRNPDAARVVTALRDVGYPTPAWLASGTTASGRAFSIQEFIVGERNLRLEVPTAELLIDLIARQRRLEPPTTFDWTTHMHDRVFTDHPTHAPLVSAGGEIEALFRHALDTAAPYRDADLPHGETVHSDLQPSNVLLRDGRVAGVIDMDAVGRGCATYDALHAAVQGVLWGGDPDAVALMHRFIIDAYGAAPVLVAAATLTVEALGWMMTNYPERLETFIPRYDGWLCDLRAMAR